MTISLCRHEEVQCPFQGWTPRHPRLPGIPEVLGFLLIFLFYSVKGEMPCSSRVPQFPTQDSLSPAFQKSPTWGRPLRWGPRGGFIPHQRWDHRLLPAHFIFCWWLSANIFPLCKCPSVTSIVYYPVWESLCLYLSHQTSWRCRSSYCLYFIAKNINIAMVEWLGPNHTGGK